MGSLLKYIFDERKPTAFYCWNVSTQGKASHSPDIIELDHDCKIDPLINQQLRKNASFLGYWRIRILWTREKIRFFCLMKNGYPACIGMTQKWNLHSKKLTWLDQPGEVMGFYWTDPKYRGQGLYGKMLAHTVKSVADKGINRMYVWASTSNIPSRKGIERAGFLPMGCRMVYRQFFRLFCHSEPLENEPATVNTHK